MEQLPLFGRPRAGKADAPKPADPAKKEQLNRAVDRIREKYGTKGIIPGGLPEGEKPER